MTPAEHSHGQDRTQDAEVREPLDAAAPAPEGPTPPERQGPGQPEEMAQTEAGSDGEHMASDSATELVADLAKAQEDVAALTTDLQRLQAEYVNYKRRVDRDRELVKQNAVFSVVSSLLPVLDDIDRARDAGELEGGFKAVADSLERTIAGLGLTKFGEPGDEFDPNLHEALMHAHSPDVTTTTCQTVVQAGYLIGDRVVRAARVTVVDPEPADDDQ